MKFEEIKRIVELMSRHNLTEFKIDAEDIHLCLRRDLTGGAPAAPYAVMPALSHAPHAPIPMAPMVPTATAAPAAAVPEVAENQRTINSPIIGTFYRSPSPDAQPFVKVGDTVGPDTVICIVEAMKVMNEIKAETSGVIKKVLVENTQPVEYGQPLFIVE